MWKQFALFVKRNKAASIGAAAVLLVGPVIGTKAVIEGRRAERALVDLINTAPALPRLAETEGGIQHFDSALQNLAAAIDLAPEHLPAYWRRAWLLLGMGKWSAAAEAIRLAQQRDPANASLADILPVVEQLASATSGFSSTHRKSRRPSASS